MKIKIEHILGGFVKDIKGTLQETTTTSTRLNARIGINSSTLDPELAGVGVERITAKLNRQALMDEPTALFYNTPLITRLTHDYVHDIQPPCPDYTIGVVNGEYVIQIQPAAIPRANILKHVFFDKTFIDVSIIPLEEYINETLCFVTETTFIRDSIGSDVLRMVEAMKYSIEQTIGYDKDNPNWQYGASLDQAILAETTVIARPIEFAIIDDKLRFIGVDDYVDDPSHCTIRRVQEMENCLRQMARDGKQIPILDRFNDPYRCWATLNIRDSITYAFHNLVLQLKEPSTAWRKFGEGEKKLGDMVMNVHKKMIDDSVFVSTINLIAYYKHAVHLVGLKEKYAAMTLDPLCQMLVDTLEEIQEYVQKNGSYATKLRENAESPNPSKPKLRDVLEDISKNSKDAARYARSKIEHIREILSKNPPNETIEMKELAEHIIVHLENHVKDFENKDEELKLVYLLATL